MITMEQEEIEELRRRLNVLAKQMVYYQEKGEVADKLEKKIKVTLDYCELVRQEPHLTSQETAIVDMVEHYLKEDV